MGRRYVFTGGGTGGHVMPNLAVIREVSDEVAVMRRGEVVEQGEADRIFEDPQHDYTRELLAAVPSPAFMARA